MVRPSFVQKRPEGWLEQHTMPTHGLQATSEPLVEYSSEPLAFLGQDDFLVVPQSQPSGMDSPGEPIRTSPIPFHLSSRQEGRMEEVETRSQQVINCRTCPLLTSFASEELSAAGSLLVQASGCSVAAVGFPR